MKFNLLFLFMCCTVLTAQAQEKPLLIYDTFTHVEEKLQMYTPPMDAADEMLTAMKDGDFLSMEYKQKADDNSLMEFYVCKVLKKGEVLAEVKGNLVLKGKSKQEQEVKIEITEGISSNGKIINGKDIISSGVLEQDVYKFIKK